MLFAPWRARPTADGPCFFFSSRRRHTRCLSDWSSDVCSSDLEMLDGSFTANDTFVLTVNSAANSPPSISDIPDQTTAEDTSTAAIGFVIADRSEERRVGKSVDLGGRVINKKEDQQVLKGVRHC